MAGLNRRRLWQMVKKEFRQTLRDPRAARMMFIAPVLQVLIFGYVVNTDVRHLPTIVVDRDGGDTRIRAFFTRPIGFGELRRGLRSVDYPFGFVEIRLDDNGKGEGTIIPAAKIRYRGQDTIEVEDFGTFPGRLIGVQVREGRLS